MGKCNWTTSFDTANNTMTHVFSNRMKIVVDWKETTIGTFKDEVLVDKVSFDKNYSIDDYMDYQLRVAEAAEKLENYGTGQE